MIVRDAGEHWAVVLQTDHADLSGQFAEAWGSAGRFARPRSLESVVLASRRHDDGWAVWERAPLVAADSARPQGFLEVSVPTHLAFWRAATAAVVDEDALAGMLVSMHGTGLYRGRYGTHPPAQFEPSLQAEVDEFVAEQESLQERLVDATGVGEGERWGGYRLLQVVDRLSLHFCVMDPQSSERQRIERAPLDASGGETALLLTPLGRDRVRLEPCPFGEEPRRFQLRRRAVPKREWPDHASFRRDLWATPPESVPITIDGAAAG